MMNDHSFTEKRCAPRFPIAIPITYYNPDCAGQYSCETHDVSSKGIGMVTRQGFSVGQSLDFYLHMADNAEEIHRRGRVVWASQVSQDKYRIGIELEGENLKPVEIILRTISSLRHY